MWKDGLDYDKQEANRFVQHILKFLSVASKKYSKEEFAVMPLPIFFACYNFTVAGNNNLFAVQGGDRQQMSHRVHCNTIKSFFNSMNFKQYLPHATSPLSRACTHSHKHLYTQTI